MRAILGLSIMLCIISCKPEGVRIENTQHEVESKADIGFIHTVFFWMKDDFDANKKVIFEEGLKKMADIPGVEDIYWGPPAMTPRKVVDNSYDYAFIAHFADAAAQDAYQIDPIHTGFIENSKDFWEKILIYDNLVVD